MRLFKGDYATLVKESYALAEAFGENDIPSVYPTAAISAALIAQSRTHPNEFSEAYRSPNPHTRLMKEAIRLDVPFWTLAYGLSIPVATSFEAVDELDMDALIRMGDLEPFVLDALKAKVGVGVLPSSRIYKSEGKKVATADWSSFDLRSCLCLSAFHSADAYAFLLAGCSPDDIPKHPRLRTRLLSAIVLGVPADYAVAAGAGRFDPQTVARAYREGVAAEYLAEL